MFQKNVRVFRSYIWITSTFKKNKKHHTSTTSLRMPRRIGPQWPTSLAAARGRGPWLWKPVLTLGWHETRLDFLWLHGWNFSDLLMFSHWSHQNLRLIVDLPVCHVWVAEGKWKDDECNKTDFNWKSLVQKLFYHPFTKTSSKVVKTGDDLFTI